MRTRLAGLVAVVGLIAAACSGSPASPGGPGPDATTTSIAAGSTTTTSAGTPTTVAPPTGTDATVPPEGTPLAFENADGQRLEGRRFGSGSTFVVLAHMKPATMESWFPFAEELAAAGYSALAFNFRGYGGSEGDGFAVDVDTIAAIDEALRLGAEEVYVIGASMGGTGAIAASAERDVAGTVTLSAPARFGEVDAVAAAEHLQAPLMLIAAEGDDAYVAQARQIAEAAPVDADVVPLDGSRHGTNLFVDHGEQLRELIFAFIAR